MCGSGMGGPNRYEEKSSKVRRAKWMKYFLMHLIIIATELAMPYYHEVLLLLAAHLR